MVLRNCGSDWSDDGQPDRPRPTNPPPPPPPGAGPLPGDPAEHDDRAQAAIVDAAARWGTPRQAVEDGWW